MRILLVEFTSAVSGGEHSLLELVHGLRGEHELTLACPGGPLAVRARALGVAVAPIPPSQLTFRLHPRNTPVELARMARAARGLRSVVGRLRPDVVHANSIRAGLTAIPATRGSTPLVVHCRDALPEGAVGTAVGRGMLAAADHVVAISRHVAWTVGGDGWEDRRIAVVDNAVDVARFDPATLPRADCREVLSVDGGLVLSVIAQITPWKAQDLAIRTVAELRRRGRDARLLLVGEVKFAGAATTHDNRAYERELHTLVASLGLGEHVRFLGERPDPERVLAASDVLLVPSTGEPFGRTVIEAMAMGVPVAATNVGGPVEILRGGVGGRTVPSRDPAVWADAVQELAGWTPERRAGARAAAEQRFSRERHTAAMLAVYRAAAARRSSRG